MGQEPWWKGARGEWYVVAQGVIFVVILLGPRSLPGWPEWSPVLRTVGLAAGALLALVGGLLAGSGLLALGTNLSALPHPLDQAKFVERGPYRFVRHPIYSGLIIASLGFALVVHGTLTVVYALGLLVFFDIKSRREEVWLMRKFPEYAGYRERVKKLVPFVY